MEQLQPVAYILPAFVTESEPNQQFPLKHICFKLKKQKLVSKKKDPRGKVAKVYVISLFPKTFATRAPILYPCLSCCMPWACLDNAPLLLWLLDGGYSVESRRRREEEERGWRMCVPGSVPAMPLTIGQQLPSTSMSGCSLLLYLQAQGRSSLHDLYP
jgi:hypothetical protein